jgi:hypothetical protein
MKSAIREKVLNIINNKKKEIINFAQFLVQIPSINGG